VNKGGTERPLPTTTKQSGSIPTNLSTFYDRGVVYFEQGEFSRAIADFTEAMRLDVHWSCLFRRGGAYCLNRQFQEAIDDLTAAIESGADDPQAPCGFCSGFCSPQCPLGPPGQIRKLPGLVSGPPASCSTMLTSPCRR